MGGWTGALQERINSAIQQVEAAALSKFGIKVRQPPPPPRDRTPLSFPLAVPLPRAPTLPEPWFQIATTAKDYTTRLQEVVEQLEAAAGEVSGVWAR